MPRLLLHAGYLLVFSMLLDASNLIAAATPPVSFSFNFSDPSSTTNHNLEDELSFEDDATKPQNGLVNLTCIWPICNGGRMSYAHPVQLYHQTNGEVANFSTSFTFAIRRIDNTTCKGDGMAFFLANFPSKMPSKSAGEGLGLISYETARAVGSERFIAVEFDTFQNPLFDPKGGNDHIGIDINTIRQPDYTTILPDNLTLDGIMTAYIAFDSSTRMLVASLVLHDHHSSQEPIKVSAQLPDDLVPLLPPQVAVGFSAGTATCKELNQILSWSFNSTLGLVDKDRYNNKAWTIGGLILGGVVVLALVVWFLLSCRKQKRNRNAFDKGTGGARRFDYSDLAAATDHFSDDRKLGKGSFGVVYSGFLNRLDREVAVKKILRESSEGHKDFFTEVSTISEAKHKNLVKFFGWCCRGHSWNFLRFMCSCCWKKRNMELFLVYELVNNGNLDDHLQKSNATAVLPWPKRYKIVKDIASALLYLHHDCKPYILHRDIKPGNILLDENFNAKLADFGLSRIANVDSATLETTAIGSLGYIDPQCMKDGKVGFNRSSDVYSFGVVLLEMACTVKNSREQIWRLYEGGGNILKAADKRLLSTGGGFNKKEMELVIVLGLWCSSSERNHRPSMWEVMEILNHGAPLPDRTSIINSTLASTNDQEASSVSAGSNHEEAPLFSAGSS